MYWSRYGIKVLFRSYCLGAILLCFMSISRSWWMMRWKTHMILFARRTNWSWFLWSSLQRFLFADSGSVSRIPTLIQFLSCILPPCPLNLSPVSYALLDRRAPLSVFTSRFLEKIETSRYRIYTCPCLSPVTCLWTHRCRACGRLHRSEIFCNPEFCRYIHLYWSCIYHPCLLWLISTHPWVALQKTISLHPSMML